MTEPRIVTLVPRRATAERDSIWRYTRAWWEKDHPDWTIVEGHHDEDPLFNRSIAVNRAAEEAGDWDVAVILDADVLTDPKAVEAAVRTAIDTNGMVVAGDERHDLTRQGTRQVIAGYRGNWDALIGRILTVHWSSCVVVTRSLWNAVGGFDPLFEGWGYEDDAFKCACETMAERPMLRVSGTIWHLWHSTQPAASLEGPNRDRAQRYLAAMWDKPAIRALMAESGPTVRWDLQAEPRIPRRLLRTVPAHVNADVKRWEQELIALHPGWEVCTFDEPLDPADFPITGPLWPRCANGAQKAGLIRLESLVTCGGVYVDSDVQPVRSFEPLLHLPAFAAWEDEHCIPDAVLGAEAHHPAFEVMLGEAMQGVLAGEDAWTTGPGVTTRNLPGRDDVLVLPPGAFYPYHYLQKRTPDANDGPWVFARHHWHGSWLTPEQRRANEARQR